ncbi:MAG: hypothetical protein JRF60_01690 [Deltaproteobacteria bacterium]|nr:hypothetical protein [Deltaproteobacteria bacterium]
MKFPFNIINLKEKYETDILDCFNSEYMHGKTPNPCTRCNYHKSGSSFRQKTAGRLQFSLSIAASFFLTNTTTMCHR